MSAPTTEEVRARIARLQGYAQDRPVGERNTLESVALPIAEERDARAAEVARLKALVPPPLDMSDGQREFLGRYVRMVWMEWAREQPHPKPSWLVPWADLSEADREVDRRIGERVAALAAPMLADRETEVARLRSVADGARQAWADMSTRADAAEAEVARLSLELSCVGERCDWEPEASPKWDENGDEREPSDRVEHLVDALRTERSEVARLKAQLASTNESIRAMQAKNDHREGGHGCGCGGY